MAANMQGQSNTTLENQTVQSEPELQGESATSTRVKSPNSSTHCRSTVPIGSMKNLVYGEGDDFMNVLLYDYSGFYKDKEEINILLIGDGGCGKSTLGNLLVGKAEFATKMSGTTVTKEHQSMVYNSNNIAFHVHDLPGLEELSLKDDLLPEYRHKIDVYILVINLGIRQSVRSDAHFIKRMNANKLYNFKEVRKFLPIFSHRKELESFCVNDFLGQCFPSLQMFLKSAITFNGFLTFDESWTDKSRLELRQQMFVNVLQIAFRNGKFPLQKSKLISPPDWKLRYTLVFLFVIFLTIVGVTVYLYVY